MKPSSTVDGNTERPSDTQLSVHLPQWQKIVGVVLAGGQGSRMGGVDKGLVQLNGAPMIAQVLTRFAPQVSALAINANRSTEQYASLGYPIFSDELSGYAGPLAGISVAMQWAGSLDAHWLVSAPCDSPFLPTDFVARLHAAAHDSTADIAVARTIDGTQPVFALYRTQLLESLHAFLATGKRKIDAWTAQHKTVHCDFADVAAFANINTAEELVRFAQGNSSLSR